MYSIIIQGKSLNGSFTEKTLLIQQSIDYNHENTINTFFRCSIIKPITVSNGKGESVVFDKGCYTITSLLFLIKYNTHHSQYPILLVMVVFTLIPIVQCE